MLFFKKKDEKKNGYNELLFCEILKYNDLVIRTAYLTTLRTLFTLNYKRL